MHAIEQLDDGYRAGACNIGPEEIEARRRTGVIGIGIAMLAVVGFVVLGAPSWIRWSVALPVAVGAAGLLQARLRFCAAYGFRGLRGLVGLGRPEHVEDPAARAVDRRRAIEIGAASAVLGLAAAAILVALPL
jgi:hypothetical protein